MINDKMVNVVAKQKYNGKMRGTNGSKGLRKKYLNTR